MWESQMKLLLPGCSLVRVSALTAIWGINQCIEDLFLCFSHLSPSFYNSTFLIKWNLKTKGRTAGNLWEYVGNGRLDGMAGKSWAKDNERIEGRHLGWREPGTNKQQRRVWCHVYLLLAQASTGGSGQMKTNSNSRSNASSSIPSINPIRLRMMWL